MNRKQNTHGFTLVEIMIVVAIIALLAAIAIPNLVRAKIAANDAAAKATLKTISNALENYFASNSGYPTDFNDLLGDTPPYLSDDYFVGTYSGFTFAGTSTVSSYLVTAYPVSANFGTTSITISTGAILSQ